MIHCNYQIKSEHICTQTVCCLKGMITIKRILIISEDKAIIDGLRSVWSGDNIIVSFADSSMAIQELLKESQYCLMIWDTQWELLFRAYRIVRLIKPIGIDACAEQIRALFRQEQITEFGNVTLAFGTELEIDRRCHLITVDEKQILLMPTEFELLHHMAERPGQVFSNEQLYTHIGGDVPDLVMEKTVTVHLSNLRR